MWFGGQSLHPALLRRLVRYGVASTRSARPLRPSWSNCGLRWPRPAATPPRSSWSAASAGHSRTRRARRISLVPPRRFPARSRRDTRRSASSPRCSRTTSTRSGRSAVISWPASRPRSAGRRACGSRAPEPARHSRRRDPRRRARVLRAALGPARWLSGATPVKSVSLRPAAHLLDHGEAAIRDVERRVAALVAHHQAPVADARRRTSIRAAVSARKSSAFRSMRPSGS